MLGVVASSELRPLQLYPMPRSDSYMSLAMDRYRASRDGLAAARKDWVDDLKYVSGDPKDHWDPAVYSNRVNAEEPKPALTFDRCGPLVQGIVNQARKDRPQPKIVPGDDGQTETAEMLEGKLRHMQYASQSDVADDCAIMYAAAGGFGYERVTCEYTDSKGFNQEPRIRRILDPLSQYPDPTVQEFDWSDAKFWFSREWITRDEYERRGYPGEPIQADSEYAPEWADNDHVCIAEYWWVEITTRDRIVFEDPELGRFEDFEDTLFPQGIVEEDHPHVTNRRAVEVRIVHRDVIDGEKKLEEEIWPGEWIPIIPVLGQEIVVEGKRRFKSALRYQRDPQQLLNAAASSMAERLGSRGELIGTKGQFSDGKWRDGKSHRYLEIEPVTIGGTPAPLPIPNPAQPSLQDYQQALLVASDQTKASSGYTDNLLRPSQANVSGIAIQRRDNQAELNNFHFEGNLIHAQWHRTRVCLDLFLKLTDTSRAVRTRSEDGKTGLEPVGVAMSDGSVPQVPGFEGQPHHDIHSGSYSVEISSGKGYQARVEEELDSLIEVVTANPQLLPMYLDRVFHLMGYPDLEERATLLLPPQIQQSMQGKQQGISPAEVQLRAQVQQLQQAVQQLGMAIKTKQVEQQGRLAVENTKQAGELQRNKLTLIGDLMKQQGEHAQAHHEMMGDHRMQAIEKVLDIMMAMNQAQQQPQQPGGQAAA